MNADQWEEVVALFERALEVPTAEREKFLDAQTSSNAALRERVAAMLRADAAAHSLFGDTANGEEAPVKHAPTLEGRTIGTYTIVREIGRGGMATVYLAYDAKHRRSVALKLLTADATSAVRGERFRREIGVVAKLQHPYILPLYDSGRVAADEGGEQAKGLLYYAMPLVEGESLRQRIARDGPLPVGDVCRIVSEVAAALDYAHRRGVLHRDVKPANILLSDEHAFLADFGVAHLLEDATGERTVTGVLIGTPAYMSPEQASGERGLDSRSDVYALGCMVFEMLTGVAPFGGAAAPMVIAAHRGAPPPSAASIRPDLSPAVDDVLRRALAKRPEDRFATARELAEALIAAVTPGSSLKAPGIKTRSRAVRRRGMAVAALAAAVVLTGLAARRLRRPALDMPSIVVLPIENTSNDSADAYFVDGLTEELTGELAQLGRIRVVPRTTAYAYRRRYVDIRRIGRELGVSRVFEATSFRDGDVVVIHANLIDSKTGDHVWTNRYERNWSGMLKLQTELAGTIVEQLKVKLLPTDLVRMAARHTANPDAYARYFLGRHFFNIRTADALDSAAIEFQRALDIDSTYALAYTGLSDTYSILAWTGSAAPDATFELAERAARRAVLLDSNLAESHVSLGIIQAFHHWSWGPAERSIARAIALNSTLASAWYWQTWPLIASGRPGEAMKALQRSRELDPLPITSTRIGTLLVWDGRYREADSVFRKILEDYPDFPVARVQLARVLSTQGRHAEAITALPPDSVQLGSYEAGIPGFVYARAGMLDAALAASRALEARKVVPFEGVAAIYAALGDKQRAFASLERAIESHGIGLIFLGVEPMYDNLRDDPRFTKALARIGVTAIR